MPRVGLFEFEFWDMPGSFSTSYILTPIIAHTVMSVNPNPNKPAQPNSVPATTPLSKLDLEPVGKRYVLDEQRRAFDHVNEAGSALDSKLQALLGSGSLIISLVGTVQLVNLRQGGDLFFWGLGVTIVLYIIMVGVILWGLRPLEYYEPIDNDWEKLDRTFFGENEDDVLEQLISNYLKYIEQNRRHNVSKVKMQRIATGLLMFIVAVILFSIPFSLTAPATQQGTPTPQATPSQVVSPSSPPTLTLPPLPIRTISPVPTPFTQPTPTSF